MSSAVYSHTPYFHVHDDTFPILSLTKTLNLQHCIDQTNGNPFSHVVFLPHVNLPIEEGKLFSPSCKNNFQVCFTRMNYRLPEAFTSFTNRKAENFVFPSK